MLEPDVGFPNKRLIHSHKVVYLDFEEMAIQWHLTFVVLFIILNSDFIQNVGH